MDGEISATCKALDQLAGFFRRLNMEGHALRMEQLKQRLERDGRQALPELAGNEFWGGAGSYLDISFYDVNFRFLQECVDLQQVAQEYSYLLFQLAKTLKQLGTTSYLLDSAYEVLKKENETL